MKTYYMTISLISIIMNLNLFAQQAGDPDSTFGSDGIVIIDFNNLDDGSYSSTVQPDGKIVLAGTSVDGTLRNMSLCRLNTDAKLFS